MPAAALDLLDGMLALDPAKRSEVDLHEAALLISELFQSVGQGGSGGRVVEKCRPYWVSAAGKSPFFLIKFFSLRFAFRAELPQHQDCHELWSKKRRRAQEREVKVN